MPIERTPRQVAKRALILGALAFRSSLEVTDHYRVIEFSRGLIPWLMSLGCGDELDPIEREELATPLGQLSDSQKVDVNWAGEAAAFFCWMLKLGEPLEETRRADQSCLPNLLRILRPEAAEILQSATLRGHTEIVKTCQHFVLIRRMLQESRIEPAASAIIRRLSIRKLNDLGLFVTEEDIGRATEAVRRMTAGERKQVAGLYLVRDRAAMWFLSDRETYFE